MIMLRERTTVQRIKPVTAKTIPIIFHNLRGYDGHLLMKGIHKVEKKKLDCIPHNIERYISFSVGKLQFIDPYQFMASSLETLVHNLDDMSSPT